MSMYLKGSSKNTTDLCTENPGAQTQTETLMKVNVFKHFIFYMHTEYRCTLHLNTYCLLVGDFGSPEMSLTSRTTRPNELARYPERFKEPMHSRDYRPAGEFLDIRSSSSPLRMDRQSRLDRDIRYANNLDKITSTLLELVKRK